VSDDLHAVDRLLLAAVQQDARTPQATLAGRVGLSAPAVNRRLRRLADAPRKSVINRDLPNPGAPNTVNR